MIAAPDSISGYVGFSDVTFPTGRSEVTANLRGGLLLSAELNAVVVNRNPTTERLSGVAFSRAASGVSLVLLALLLLRAEVHSRFQIRS